MTGTRLRGLLAGPASVALVLLMLAGCLFLWVGVPLVWLWIGSQVEASSSLGTALMVTMTGVILTVTVAGLAWLNRRHAELREVRNLPASEQTALETMFVASAAIAIVLFLIWFFGLAGASPIPLNIGY